MDAQAEHRHPGFDVRRAAQAAQRLADHRREGRALDAPAHDRHAEQVAEDVQHRAQHQKIERAFAVAQRPQGGGQKVIEKGKDQPGKHHPQVARRDGQHLGRHLHQPQQRVCQQDAEGRKGQRKDRPRDGGGGHLLFQPGVVLGAEGGADQDARPQTHPVDKEDGQGHQRVGGADGSQGVLAHKTAYNDAVGGVVGQLEEVAQHQRDGEGDQRGGDGPACHVVCHAKRFFLL